MEDYGDLTAADGDVRVQAVLASLELAAGTDCEQVTFEPVSGRRRLRRRLRRAIVARGVPHHPSSERGISSRLVGQLQDSLGDGSFTAALETAAAGTDSSLASLRDADLDVGASGDQTNQILDEALAADPGQALVFTWTPTRETDVNKIDTIPDKRPRPIGAAHVRGGLRRPEGVGRRVRRRRRHGRGHRIAPRRAPVVMVGRRLPAPPPEAAGAGGKRRHRGGPLRGRRGSPPTRCEVGPGEGRALSMTRRGADGGSAIAGPSNPVKPWTRTSSSTSSWSRRPRRRNWRHCPEGSTFEPSVVASEVGDDEWDAMLNDVDDEESTETWNEDLASTLLFKLAQGDCEEGFAHAID